MLQVALSFMLMVAASTAVSEVPPQVNGLTWFVHIRRNEFTIFESVEFFACVEVPSADGAQVTVRTAPPSVVLTLTRDGSEPVRKPLSAVAQPPVEPLVRYEEDDEWFAWAEGSSRPVFGALRPGRYRLEWEDPILWAKSDLRSIFGALRPGHYTLQFELAAADYETDLPGFSPQVLSSAPFRFTVIETSLKLAEERNVRPESRPVKLRLETIDGQQVAVLSNDGSLPLTFHSGGEGPVCALPQTWDSEGEASGDRLVFAFFEFDRWDGRRWNGPYYSGHCGTGLVDRVLEPGESIVLQVPSPLETGILRLELRYRTGRSPDRSFYSATSAAFVHTGD